MVGASNILENKQKGLTSSHEAKKNAFSELSSGDLRSQKCFSNPSGSGSGFVDRVSSKQSSEHCLSSSATGNGVQSKRINSLQSGVIGIVTIVFDIVIKVLVLLDVVVTAVLAAVGKPSLDFQEVISHSQSSMGSPSSTPTKYPVHSCQLVSGTGSHVFEVTPVEEVEVNIADCFCNEYGVVTDVSFESVQSSKEIGCHHEENDKRLHSHVEYTSSLSGEVGCVSGQAKIAQAVTDSSSSQDKPNSVPVANEVPNVLTGAVDSICFPFPPDSSMISVNIENFEFQCLVDTGAAITAVSAYVWNKYLRQAYPSLDSSDSGSITSVNGDRLDSLGKTTMRFEIQSEEFPFEAHVIENLTYDIILGRDFLQTFYSKIDFDSGVIKFISGETPLESQIHLCSVHADFSFVIPPQSEVVVPARLNSIPQTLYATGIIAPRSTLPEKYSVFGASELVRVSEDGIVPIRLINPSFQPVKIYRRTRLGDFEQVDSAIATFELNSMEHSKTPPSQTINDSQHNYSNLPDLSDSVLSDGDKVKFRNLFHEYHDVFAFSDDQLGRTSLVQHTIDTGDAMPIKQRPYRTTPENKQEIDRQVNDMLQRGVIQESISPWSSPVVLVKKKNGEMRFCIDFRCVNRVTKKDSFPMPLVADTLDALSGTQYFTTLDLKSGYWQIELDPSAREKTAFVTHNGLYEFLVMPFGLTNSGASFQRLMGHILRGLEYRFALIYIDDIIIFSKSIKEHLTHLEEVFRRLREANVKLNPKKCSFVKQKVEYLGHVVTPDGVMPNPEKVRVVRDFPVPKNLKELRTFMGLANYYRRFVKGFAYIANPLNALTKKGSKFEWTEACADAFDKLKRALISAPILAYPDFKNEFLLFVDASSTGIGFTLAQEQNGKEVVIAYNGRGLNQAEKNYSTTEREALALVEGIKKFQPYLFGRKFTVITDHSSLRWLMNVKDATGRLARWSLLLQQYNFEVVHRPGKAHSNADSLSRRPYEFSADVSSLQKEDNQEAKTRELQRRDPELSEIIDFLENDVVPLNEKSARKLLLTSETFYMGKDGLLYHLDQNQKRNSHDVFSQLVIPQALRFEVLSNVHDHVSGGHFGVHKTFQKVKQRYWWKRMFKDVEHWCKSCQDCSMRKSPRNSKKAPLLPIPVENAFDRVAVDILGPFPVSRKGNRYICVFSDYLSRWCEAFPVPSVEASVIARLLVDEVISRHGAPKVLLSDRGKNFLSKLIAEVCKIFQIHKVNTSSYHPQTDGLVERFNSTLCQSLSMYVAKDHKDWDEYIPLILFAHRTSVCEAIGDSPFYVLYGREPRLPIDVKLLPKESEDLSSSVFEHRKRIVEKVELAQNIARENIQRSQQKMKEYYDQKAKMPTFEVGQRVWVYTPKTKKGRSKKLLHNWYGPYRIVEQSSPVHFRLRTDSNKKVTFAVHANRMKPFVDPDLRPIDPPLVDDPNEPYLHDSDIPGECFKDEQNVNDEECLEVSSPQPSVLQTQSQPEQLTVDNQTIFGAERILKRRKRKGQNQYLVKWLGYPTSKSTWEPEENILDKRLIENFENSQS